MKRHFIFAIVVILILIVVLFVLNDYKLDIAESKVVNISFYDESRISKKVITNSGDISVIVEAVNSLHNWGKCDIDDVPDGGIGYYLVFFLENDTKIIRYNQTDHDGHGFLRDGNVKIKVSGLNLEDVWNSLDYEEIEARPALELSLD